MPTCTKNEHGCLYPTRFAAYLRGRRAVDDIQGEGVHRVPDDRMTRDWDELVHAVVEFGKELTFFRRQYLVTNIPIF